MKLKESNRYLSKIVLPRAERPLEEGKLVYLLLGDLIAPTDQPLSGRLSIKNSRLTGGEREREREREAELEKRNSRRQEKFLPLFRDPILSSAACPLPRTCEGSQFFILLPPLRLEGGT